MARPPKKRPISVTVYQGCDAAGEPIDGEWHGYLPIKDAHGKVIRRAHRRGKSKEECEDKIRELEDELAAEAARRAANIHPKSAKTYRLHAWLRYWLYEITFPTVEYNTFRDYRIVIEHYVIPNTDDVDLPDLESAHIEAMLKKLRRSGSTDKPQRAYIRLRMALKAAAARPKETGLWYNPILAVRMPEHRSPEVTPFTVEQTKRILAQARKGRNSARWTCGMALGIRPGEVRALQREDFYLVDAKTFTRIAAPWDGVDLDKALGVLVVDENLYRRKWLHGCDDPHACGTKYHRYRCPGHGRKHERYHRDGCPTVAQECEPDCVKHAAECKARHGGSAPDGTLMPGGQVRKPPKSEAGKRRWLLPRPVTVEFLAHLGEQDKERARAGHRWLGSGAMFATKWGGLLNERDDWGEFQEILAGAGLAPARPYDGRHGAATMMLIKRVDKRLVMDAMGWSSESMLKRYQHILEEMRREAGHAIGDLLWDSEDSATDHATRKVIDLGEARRKRA